MDQRAPCLRTSKGLLATFVLTALTGCYPPDTDTLVDVSAPSPSYRFRINRHLRESTLWRSYVDQLAAQRSGDTPVVRIDVVFDRKITEELPGADYDDGVVLARYGVTDLVSGATLVSETQELEIPIYVIVREAAERDEVQHEAFKKVEEQGVRQLIYWMDRGLIRAMGGSGNEAFITALEDARDRHRTIGLREEARRALDSLGATSPPTDD